MSFFADEAGFLGAVDRVFAAIERALDASGLDVDSARQGAVLEIGFEDGSRVILNAQAPLHEIWLASRSGGRHFRASADGLWSDTRSGAPLTDELAAALSLHSGQPVALRADLLR